MATIIDAGKDAFIAGDPPTELGLGEHWCEYCRGDGLEYDWDGELALCSGCWGACVVDCTDTACLEHSTLHPQLTGRQADPLRQPAAVVNRVEYLAELEEALRCDADMTRLAGGASVRLNLDEAADAVAELRALLEGRAG